LRLILIFFSSFVIIIAHTQDRLYGFVDLGLGTSAGDLAHRFGNFYGVGFGFEYEHALNYAFRISGSADFGKTVKEDVLRNIRSPQSDIITGDYSISYPNVEMRAYALAFGISKRLKKNNFGIAAGIDLGYLWHKIDITDVNSTLPQLYGPYREGYDHLTAGPFISPDLALKYDKSKFQLVLTFESKFAFTKSQRDFDFSSLSKSDKALRLDIMPKVKIAWYIRLGEFDGSRKEVEYR